MLQTHLPVDTSKKKRRLTFLLGTFLVAAILVAAVLVTALVFSLSTRGQTPTPVNSGKQVHTATSPSPISTTVGSQNIVTAPTPTPTLAPAPTKSRTTCPATIENGSTGSLVVSLQNKLNALYAKKAFPDSPYNFTYPLAKDGIFGAQTENAVKDFQTKNGIGVDGIVGPTTWHSLGAC